MRSTLSPSRGELGTSVTPLVVGGLILHGIAHFAGTSATLELVDHHDHLSILGGSFTPDSRGLLTTLAWLWAVLGLAFIAAAVTVAVGWSHARSWLLVVATASLIMSVIGLWAAVLGVVIDLAVIVGIYAAPEAFDFDE